MNRAYKTPDDFASCCIEIRHQLRADANLKEMLTQSREVFLLLLLGTELIDWVHHKGGLNRHR